MKKTNEYDTNGPKTQTQFNITTITARDRFHNNSSSPATTQNFYPTTDHYQKSNIKTLKYELIESKNRYNNANRELKSLRVSYKKLDTENKANFRLIKNILGVQANDKPSKKEMKKIKEKVDYVQMTQYEKMTLEESYRIKILKRDLAEYQQELNSKIKEINEIRQKAKVVRMIEMQTSISIKEDELKELKKTCDDFEGHLIENERRIYDLQVKLDYYKTLVIQSQSESLENDKALQEILKQRDELEKTREKMEIKLRKKEAQYKKMKTQQNDIENQINQFNDEKQYLEGLSVEKEEYEKRDEENMKKINQYKNNNEQLNKELLEMEEINSELVYKVMKYEKERPKLIEKSKEPPTSYKQKEKRIAELQKEIKEAHIENQLINEQNEAKGGELKSELNETKNENEELKKKLENSNQENGNYVKKIEQLNNRRKELYELNDKKIQEIEKNNKLLIIQKKEMEKDNMAKEKANEQEQIEINDNPNYDENDIA